MEEQLQKQTGFAAGRAVPSLGVCSTHKEPFVSPHFFMLSFQAAAAARPCASLWDRAAHEPRLCQHTGNLCSLLWGQRAWAGGAEPLGRGCSWREQRCCPGACVGPPSPSCSHHPAWQGWPCHRACQSWQHQHKELLPLHQERQPCSNWACGGLSSLLSLSLNTMSTQQGLPG